MTFNHGRWLNLERVSAAAILVSVMVGSFALVGWWLDVVPLTNVRADLPNMAPNTALSLVLAGAALELLRKEPVSRFRRVLAGAAAAVVALIGVLTLTEYLFDLDLQIDRFVVFAPADLEPAPFLGRPGFPTAWALVFIGLALWLIDVRPRRCPEIAQGFILLAVTIALLALTGIANGVPNFYGRVSFWPNTGMAVHTALAIALFGAGAISARPNRGLMAILRSEGGGGVVARRLILAPVAIPLVMGLLLLAARRAGVYPARMDWPQLGGWLFSLLNIFIFTLIIWWSASVVYQVDNNRRRAREELRQLNTRLEDANRGLEDRVALRTAELQATAEELRAMSQQLWQAAKLATMGELAASIAHELNNPLATVSLHLESMREEAPASSPGARRLQVIEQEVDRMAHLVSNLLQFSRPGQQQISTLDVREELERTLEIIHYVFRKNRITVDRDFAQPVPMIQADRQKLRQVFLNLLMNACDAMPGGGTVTLRTKPVELPAGQPGVAIEVVDNGVGIAPENLSRVMEPFFTTKQEGKGTGLGLPICRRIIQEHHGTIELASKLDAGTTVRIDLPVANGANGRIANV